MSVVVLVLQKEHVIVLVTHWTVLVTVVAKMNLMNVAFVMEMESSIHIVIVMDMLKIVLEFVVV
jgi:hypothetical protein